MASITLKDIPDDLHAQLKREGEANFRSLAQETLRRLQQSFEIEAAASTKRDQKWVDEALVSGKETRLTRDEMDNVRDRVLSRGRGK